MAKLTPEEQQNLQAASDRNRQRQSKNTYSAQEWQQKLFTHPNGPNKDKKMWGQLVEEAAAEGRTPVMRQVDYEDRPSAPINWEGKRQANDPAFMAQYWGTDLFGIDGRTEDEWMRDTYPERYADGPPDIREFPGAIGFDAYDKPIYSNAGPTANWDAQYHAQAAIANESMATAEDAWAINRDAGHEILDQDDFWSPLKNAGAMFSGVLSDVGELASWLVFRGDDKKQKAVQQIQHDILSAPILPGGDGVVGEAGATGIERYDTMVEFFRGSAEVLKDATGLAQNLESYWQTGESMSDLDRKEIEDWYAGQEYMMQRGGVRGLADMFGDLGKFWDDGLSMGDVVYGNWGESLWATVMNEEDDKQLWGTLRMNEYVRTLKQNPGMSAYALERDLANPNWQMIPEVLNPAEELITLGLGTALKVIRTSRAVAPMVTLMPEAAKALGATDLRHVAGWSDEGIAAAQKANIVEGVMTDAASVTAKLADDAGMPNTFKKAAGWLFKSNGEYKLGKRVEGMVSWIAGQVMDVAADGKVIKADWDGFFDLARTVSNIGSSEPKVVQAAIERLVRENPDWMFLLTERGMEGVVALNKTFETFGGFGKLDRNLAKLLEESALNGKNWAHILKYADDFGKRTVEKMFPSVADMHTAAKAAGQKGVPYGFRAVAATHNLLQSKLYSRVNRFYSVVYLGATPGYAVRNAIQNFVQTVFDEGLSGVVGARHINESFDWMKMERIIEEGSVKGFLQKYGLRGHYSDDTVRAFKKDLGAADSVVKMKQDKLPWWRKAIDARWVSNTMEKFASASIWAKSIRDTMKAGLKNTVSINLRKIDGIAPQMAKNLEADLIKYRGDVGKAIRNQADEIRSGIRRVVGHSDMPPELQKMADSIDNLDIDELVERYDSVEDAVAELRDIQKLRKDKAAADIAKEVPHPNINPDDISPDDVLDVEFFQKMADDVTAGVTPQKTLDAFTNYYNINKKTNRAVSGALTTMHRNITYGLKRILQLDTKIDSFWRGVSEKWTLRIPDSLGGGKMDGWRYWDGDLGKVAAAKEEEIFRVYDVAKREIQATGNTVEIEEIWKRIGMDGTSTGKSKGDLMTEINRKVLTDKKALWQEYRNTNVSASIEYSEHMKIAAEELGAKGITQPKTVFREVRASQRQALGFDKHIPAAMTRDQIGYADRLMKKGETLRAMKQYALAYAREYGLATISESGAPLDQFMLNILNKELGRNFTSLDNLHNVTEIQVRGAMLNYTTDVLGEVAERPNGALEALGKLLSGDRLTHDETLQVNLMLDILEDLNPSLRKEFGDAIYGLSKSANAGDYDAAGGFAKALSELGQKVEAEMVHLRKIPSVDELVSMPDAEFEELYKRLMKLDNPTGKKVAQEGMSLRSEPLEHLDDNLKKAVGGVVDPADQAKIDAFEKAEATYDAQKTKVSDALDDATAKLDERMEGFVDKRTQVEQPENVWGEQTAPSQGRRIREGEEQEDRAYDLIEQYLTDNWAKTQTVDVKDKKKALGALKDAERSMEQMVQTQQRIASAVAEAARDFVLHDYGDRKNFDLLLGYVFPYHFWYSRTYYNWAQRIATNPSAVRAYTVFKERLAEINDDMPDYLKQSLNLSKVFGLDEDNPIMVMFEAMLNPLHGIMKQPFNDPRKRQLAAGRWMDDLGSMGPSIYTPYSMAIGGYEYLRGEKEAAKVWLGRALPQSKTIKAITSLLGIDVGANAEMIEDAAVSQGIELDPFLVVQAILEDNDVGDWWQGIAPYEESKIAKNLYGMAESGNASWEAIEDAIIEGMDNRLFRLAAANVQSQHQVGDMVTMFGSPSYRTMTKEDMQAIEIDQAVHALYLSRDGYSADEWAEQWEKLREKHPEMDLLRLARSKGVKRDLGLFYSMIRRIPPGASYRVWETLGVHEDTIQSIYDTKGESLETMPEADRNDVMDAVLEISVVLARPDDATQQEWTAVKDEIKAMDATLLDNYGEATVAKKEEYWALPYDERYEWLDYNVDYRNYMNDRTMMLGNSALLRKYYASYQQGEAFMSSRTHEYLSERFPGIEAEQRAYYDAKAMGQKVKASDRLKEYWGAKDGRDELDAHMLLSWGNDLPDGDDIFELRNIPEEKVLSSGAQELAALEYDKNNVPEYYDWDWEEWRQQFSPALQRIVEDWAFRGAELNSSAESSIAFALGPLRVEPELAKHLIREAIRDTDAEFYSPDNPPPPFGE